MCARCVGGGGQVPVEQNGNELNDDDGEEEEDEDDTDGLQVEVLLRDDHL